MLEAKKKQYLKVVFVFVIVVTIYLGDLFGFWRLEEYFVRNSFSSRWDIKRLLFKTYFVKLINRIKADFL